MLPIRKLFGRKPEDHRPESEDDVESQEDISRLNRRHSSARLSAVTEGLQDQTTVQSTKMSAGRSMFSIRSPFKRRNSTSSFQKPVCTCTRGVNTESNWIDPLSVQLQENFAPSIIVESLSESASVCSLPDENGNEAEDKVREADTTKMNGAAKHIVAASVCDERFDRSPRTQSKLSVIERRIRTQKQHSAQSQRHSLDCSSLQTDDQNSAQSVRNTDAATVTGSPRLFDKRSSATTLNGQFQRCCSSFNGRLGPPPVITTSSHNNDVSIDGKVSHHSGPPSCDSSTAFGLSSTSNGATPTNNSITGSTPATTLENSADSNPPHDDLSTASTDTQHASSVLDQPVTSEGFDIPSVGTSRSSSGISSETAWFSTCSSGLITTDVSTESTDSPVPPPRRKRSSTTRRGRLSYAGDQGGTGPVSYTHLTLPTILRV